MKWLLLILFPVTLLSKDFTAVWDPSTTVDVYYRLWISQSGGPFTVHTTTNLTSVPLSLSPGAYSFYVTAVNTNGESDPSNIYMFPPVASVVSVVTIGTNLPLPQTTTVFAEAESGVIEPPMGVVNISGVTAVETTTANSGTIEFQFNLNAGTYVIWCRLIAVNAGQDSLFVSVDGMEDAYGNESVISPNFQWTKVNGGNGGPVRTFTLLAGEHAVRFRGRESGVPLDAIYVTSDLSLTPQ